MSADELTVRIRTAVDRWYQDRAHARARAERERQAQAAHLERLRVALGTGAVS